MANSKTPEVGKPEAGSLAAAGTARPSPRARLRPLVLAPLALTLACALLGACAARAPEAPRTPSAPAGWQAAIGFLDVTGSPEVCTAVLVRQDMIVTTSHCLRPKGQFAQPNRLVFTPSAAGQQVRGAALIAEGGSVAPGNIKPVKAQTDWALVRITPPLSGIRPLPLAPLSPAMVRAKIAGGARLYSAGYGQGAKDELRTHKSCGLLPPDPNGVTEGDLFFATDCIIRLGDSGGPVVLIEGGQPRLIGLIVGFANQPGTGEPIGIVVSAKAFAGYLGGDLVSQLFPVALPEISMN
jgi:protease YdgD